VFRSHSDHPQGALIFLIKVTDFKICWKCKKLVWWCGSIKFGVCTCALFGEVCRTAFGRSWGSIPDGNIGIFHWHNPSGRNMALGLTQPLTEKITRNFLESKGGRYVGLTILPPSCADCLGISKFHPPGNFRACPGLSWDCFTFRNHMCAPVPLNHIQHP